MKCYSLRRYVNCVLPWRKYTTTLPTNIVLCEVASNPNRKQTLYETPKWKRKNCKPPGIDFFNLFIVTNRRHCVSKLLVLLKVPTPTIDDSESFSDNAWEPSNIWESRHGFTLVSHTMLRADYNQFDKHFYFFHYVCLCLKTNRSDLSFDLHKFISTMFLWRLV